MLRRADRRSAFGVLALISRGTGLRQSQIGDSISNKCRSHGSDRGQRRGEDERLVSSGLEARGESAAPFIERQV